MSHWWSNGIVYHLYIKSFWDSNKNGIGDINGVTEKLDYLKDLGVDAVWLSPFFKSPMRDNGYDVKDYLNVNELFGSNEDLNQLFKEMKKRNLKIIIDLVLNHTSIEHEWFQKAISDPTGPYRDYYIFKDKENINNARSLFGGSAWEAVDHNQYYYHTFAIEQADLNWENAKLRDEIYSIINTWIDRGVDGFRLDAITFIKKDLSYPSLEADDNDGLFSCVKTSLNKEGILDFFNDMKMKTWANKGIYTVGEAAGITLDTLADYIEPKGVVTSIFDFSYTDIDISGDFWRSDFAWTYDEFQKRLNTMQEKTQDVGMAVTYLENHDNPRSINKFYKQLVIDQKHHFHMATALHMFYLFLRGTAYIYQGQEMGMHNILFKSIDEIEDLQTIDQYERAIKKGMSIDEAMKLVNIRSRDHSRVPVFFTEKQLSQTNRIKPFVSTKDAYGCDSIEEQLKDEKSVLNFVKQLIHIKKSETIEPFLINSKYQAYKTYESVINYKRVLGLQEMIVLINMSNTTKKVDIIQANVLVSNYQRVQFDGTLEAYESIILTNF